MQKIVRLSKSRKRVHISRHQSNGVVADLRRNRQDPLLLQKIANRQLVALARADLLVQVRSDLQFRQALVPLLLKLFESYRAFPLLSADRQQLLWRIRNQRHTT